MRQNLGCKRCGARLKRDWIALNRKLIRRDLKSFLCLFCLADDFDCSTDDLILKIEEFKEQGCSLFK